MVRPEMSCHRPGVTALVEARVFEADREGADVPRRLDFAERGGRRSRNPPRPTRRRPAARPTAGAAPPKPETHPRRSAAVASKSSRSRPTKVAFQYRRTRTDPASHTSTWPGAACGATARSRRVRGHIRRKGSAPGRRRVELAGRSRDAPAPLSARNRRPVRRPAASRRRVASGPSDPAPAPALHACCPRSPERTCH